MSDILGDARRLVHDSNKFQGTGAELRDLRSATYALIQHAEALEKRIAMLEKSIAYLDQRTIGMQVLG